MAGNIFIHVRCTITQMERRFYDRKCAQPVGHHVFVCKIRSTTGKVAKPIGSALSAEHGCLFSALFLCSFRPPFV